MGVKIKHMSVNTALMKRLNLRNVRHKQLIENKKLDLYNSLRKVNPMNFDAPYTYYEAIYQPKLWSGFSCLYQRTSSFLSVPS